MKKIIVALICISSISIKSFSQESILNKKYLEKYEIQKPRTDLISEEKLIDKDSTISKNTNGFNIKKSSQDNMNYLQTNKENIANKKMHIKKGEEIATMPTRKLPLLRNRFGIDTTKRVDISGKIKN